jgi:hypothetical protein
MIVALLIAIFLSATAGNAAEAMKAAAGVPTGPEHSRTVFDMECPPVLDDDAEGKRQIPVNIDAAFTSWDRNARFWERLWTLLTFGSVILGVLAGSSLIADDGRIKFRSITALGAALCSSILGSLNPSEQATRNSDAWVYMKTAITTFQNNPAMTRCELNRAYVRAESIVHRSSSSGGGSGTGQTH